MQYMSFSMSNVPVIFHDVGLSEFTQEIFVVRDNYELEVGVALPFIDNAATVDLL